MLLSTIFCVCLFVFLCLRAHFDFIRNSQPLRVPRSGIARSMRLSVCLLSNKNKSKSKKQNALDIAQLKGRVFVRLRQSLRRSNKKAHIEQKTSRRANNAACDFGVGRLRPHHSSVGRADRRLLPHDPVRRPRTLRRCCVAACVLVLRLCVVFFFCALWGC